MHIISINDKDYTILLNNYPLLILICQYLYIDIPRFCYHDSLNIAGNCRMCLIEDNKTIKPIIACAMQVENNDIFFTTTLKVLKARESVLEFLLLNHPLDCPICDQGGECDLQDLNLVFGSDRGRVYNYKRAVTVKYLTPFIKLLMNRCIHCTRCVRFAMETNFNSGDFLGLIGRGSNSEISTYTAQIIKTDLISNIVDLCPVGALTHKTHSFTLRS